MAWPWVVIPFCLPFQHQNSPSNPPWPQKGSGQNPLLKILAVFEVGQEVKVGFEGLTHVIEGRLMTFGWCWQMLLIVIALAIPLSIYTICKCQGASKFERP